MRFGFYYFTINREIDDALWLTETRCFDIIRDKIKLDASEVIDNQYPLFYWPARALSILLEEKQYDIIHSLLDNRSRTSLKYCFFNAEVVDAAIRHDAPLTLLDKIGQHFIYSITYRAYLTAAEIGRVDVLQWMRTNRKEIELPLSTADIAASNGRLNVMRYLNECNATFTSNTLDCAIKAGHRVIIDYLVNNRTEGMISDDTIDLLAKNKEYHELITILINKKELNAKYSLKAFRRAVKHGNLKLLKLLFENSNVGIGNIPEQIDVAMVDALKTSIKYSIRECFVYILEQNDRYKTQAKQLVNDYKVPFKCHSTDSNEIEFYKYLKSQSYTMDRAIMMNVASIGNVKLMENVLKDMGGPIFDGGNRLDKQEMEWIITWAIRSGNTDMVLYLYDRFSKDHLQYMVSGIMLGISKDVTQFLFQTYKDLTKSTFLMPAFYYGCLDIVKYCFKKTGYHSDKVNHYLQLAVDNNQFEVFQYVVELLNIKVGYTLLVGTLSKKNSCKLIEFAHRNLYYKGLDIVMIPRYHTAIQTTYLIGKVRSEIMGTHQKTQKETISITVSCIKNLTHLKLLGSEWFGTAINCNVQIDDFTFDILVKSNRLDEIVYLFEEMKPPADDVVQTSMWESLFLGHAELSNFIIDYLLAKYHPIFPTAIYNDLMRIVNSLSSSNDTKLHHQLYHQIKSRLSSDDIISILN
ncbi:hypothetical protein PPL_03082 [Heterostelium album PN500]|uniref:Ankyrin repeat-containing protein n=1 Tax=Heterostelium pallidum (strain ATCC 26659 / Pp 5 / PN500) TaxID=670386 RepID=D3B3W1_HETP5|nr:hypothetical protein PPL_03082 [Heterostelium album PN500]EFA84009.1 hypothetical protein PPL_03082 [Heterostelium album PN500]|eukprot:XP_020436126.1 hypothetical protein PPL_03082 [Heterostelium album PN500]